MLVLLLLSVGCGGVAAWKQHRDADDLSYVKFPPKGPIPYCHELTLLDSQNGEECYPTKKSDCLVRLHSIEFLRDFDPRNWGFEKKATGSDFTLKRKICLEWLKRNRRGSIPLRDQFLPYSYRECNDWENLVKLGITKKTHQGVFALLPPYDHNNRRQICLAYLKWSGKYPNLDLYLARESRERPPDNSKERDQRVWSTYGLWSTVALGISLFALLAIVTKFVLRYMSGRESFHEVIAHQDPAEPAQPGRGGSPGTAPSPARQPQPSAPPRPSVPSLSAAGAPHDSLPDFETAIRMPHPSLGDAEKQSDAKHLPTYEEAMRVDQEE